MGELPLQKALGQRIRDLRIGAGLTQADLSARAKMPSKYLAGVEAGVRNITVRNLERLAKGLQVSPRDLMPGTKPSSTPKRKGQEALFINLVRQCDGAARTHILRLLRRISVLTAKRG
jgi:transcriptional regulator with XRE-family HTH domain